VSDEWPTPVSEARRMETHTRCEAGLWAPPTRGGAEVREREQAARMASPGGPKGGSEAQVSSPFLFLLCFIFYFSLFIIILNPNLNFNMSFTFESIIQVQTLM
jgi:hypothetical protein